MNNRTILNLCAMTALGFTLMPSNTFAQTAKDIVGTWKPVSVTVTGPDQGSIAYFGTYSVVDKVIIEKVEGGTWPNWVGTEQKRPIISLTGDEMKLSTPAASVGGTAENTYKRIK